MNNKQIFLIFFMIIMVMFIGMGLEEYYKNKGKLTIDNSSYLCGVKN